MGSCCAGILRSWQRLPAAESETASSYFFFGGGPLCAGPFGDRPASRCEQLTTDKVRQCPRVRAFCALPSLLSRAQKAPKLEPRIVECKAGTAIYGDLQKLDGLLEFLVACLELSVTSAFQLLRNLVETQLVVLEVGGTGHHLLADLFPLRVACFSSSVAAKESGDEQVAHFQVAKPGTNAPSAPQESKDMQ